MDSRTKEFIKKAIEIHGNKYDYSKSEYANSRTKIIITCLMHGDFEQSSSKHLSGQGCAKCSGHYKRTTTNFINDAIQIHGDKYDYSKVNYISLKEKVIITCSAHGDFEQSPNNHLNGQGCAKCSRRYKKTTTNFIDDAIKIHGDKYDYSKVNYVNSHTKVTIVCKNHGNFEQLPYSHLNGSGCANCGLIQKANSRKSNIDEFIEKSTEVHGDRYDYTKVVYSKANEKVIIICKKHGEFEQIPSDHYGGHGCAKCGGEQNADNYRKTTAEFVEKANLIHGDKYDYSKSNYVNSKTKLTIICQKHGEFEQIPSDHLYGKGCRLCANEQNRNNCRSDTDEFIEKSIKIHGNTYDYTKVNYLKAQEKIIIICKKHGEFEQQACSHLFGKGCSKCGVEQNANNRRYDIAEFVEKANLIHDSKYDYSKSLYINSHSKLMIICHEHGEFKQTPSHHLNGSGCPRCFKTYSMQQIDWMNFIQAKDNIHIQHGENSHEYQIPNTRFKADGYCEETNAIYEYHGDYWHGNPKKFNGNEINKRTKCTFGELYEKTLRREQQIKDMGFNLITIWESDWIKLNECVKILQRKFKMFNAK